jgi:hypothetical protein
MHGPNCIFWANLTPISLQWQTTEMFAFDESCSSPTTVRPRPGRLSTRSVFRSEISPYGVLYGCACRARNGRNRRCPARAVRHRRHGQRRGERHHRQHQPLRGGARHRAAHVEVLDRLRQGLGAGDGALIAAHLILLSARPLVLSPSRPLVTARAGSSPASTTARGRPRRTRGPTAPTRGASARSPATRTGSGPRAPAWSSGRTAKRSAWTRAFCHSSSPFSFVSIIKIGKTNGSDE